MMLITNNTQAFFALVKAGLWEQEISLSQFGEIDFSEVLNMSEEQSVVGLVSAGMEHVTDLIIPKKAVVQFVGRTLQVENRNMAMNDFISVMYKQLYSSKINPILIKGQGIAQCYERPLWRSCGDVDLLLSPQLYDYAKSLFTTCFHAEAKETPTTKEYCLTIGGWTIELHGTLHCRLTKRLDAFLDKIQDECCNKKGGRVWNNKGTAVCLPSADNDIFVVFPHIVKHFFREGVGLRQICDWCRLMWTYRTEIDLQLLEERLNEAGIMSEWKGFAALAVDWLGMPIESMPFYSASCRWKRVAKKILLFVLETGSFGRNRKYNHNSNYPVIVNKAISFCRHTWDLLRQFFVFPLDSIIVWGSMVKIGITAMKER